MAHIYIAFVDTPGIFAALIRQSHSLQDLRRRIKV